MSTPQFFIVTAQTSNSDLAALLEDLVIILYVQKNGFSRGL